jgi:hypothetical protein
VAAIDYGLLSLERDEQEPVSIPGALLLQARKAARAEVSIDIVLRRYTAGYTVFSDFLMQEASLAEIEAVEVHRLLRKLGQLFDQLLASIATEHGREVSIRSGAPGFRRSERLRRLVEGESVDETEFDYDFHGNHLGLVSRGPEAFAAILNLPSVLDCRIITLERSDGNIWAWIGGRSKPSSRQLKGALARHWPEATPLSVGDSTRGLGGWRLTHRQAKAAFPIAQLYCTEPVYYSGLALLASTLTDDLLRASLRSIFLKPLECERGSGKTARETLRAYFAAGRNASSAAALLGVNRRTVSNRLRAIEERLDQRLESVGPEIEIALRLDEADRLRAEKKRRL